MPIRPRLTRSGVAGLLLIAPLVVTLVNLGVAMGWLLGFIDPIVRTSGLIAHTGNDQRSHRASRSS